MATQTVSSLDALLKDVYAGPAQEMLNQETYLIDQIIKVPANKLGDVLFRNGGRRVVVPVHSGRNRGRGSIADGGTLPTAGKQSFQDAIIPMRGHFQAIELTDMVTRQAEGDNEGAFASALTVEVEGGVQDLRKDIVRQAYGTGDGLLGTVAANATSATQSIDTAQYIAVGDTVDIRTKSDGTSKGAGLTVNTVTYTGTAGSSTQARADVVFSSSAVCTTADGVYVAGNRNNEMDGLRNALATTGRTLHSINSSTAGNGFWDPIVKSPGTTYTTAGEDLYIQLAQGIRSGGNGRAPDIFLSTLGAVRRLANTYVSQKRWNDAKATDIGGGYSAINVSAGGTAVPVLADVDAPNGFAFAIKKSAVKWAELDTPDWLRAPDGTGSTLHLKDGSTAGTKVAAWQSWFGWYAELAFLAPNQGGALTQIADDIPPARV